MVAVAGAPGDGDAADRLDAAPAAILPPAGILTGVVPGRIDGAGPGVPVEGDDPVVSFSVGRMIESRQCM